MVEERANAQAQQFLSFYIAGEEYAVSILEVKELIEYTAVTKMPSMPPFIRGVANHRGSVVPVLDLAVRFGFPSTPITKWTCIVMLEFRVEGEDALVGVLADSVSQVVEFLPEDIEPPPTFGTRASAAFLKGMGRSGKKFVLILNLEHLLSAKDLDQAARQAEALVAEPAAAVAKASAS